MADIAFILKDLFTNKANSIANANKGLSKSLEERKRPPAYTFAGGLFMHTCPVFDLFTQVGEITFFQEGLYFRIQGEICSERDDFLHLYAHGENRTEQLGLFIPQGDRLSLRCRISVRRMGEIKVPHFSINSLPFRPLTKPLADGFLPCNALVLTEGETRRIFVADEMPFDEDILPFFCFLVPETAEGLPCLTLKVDGNGRPVLPTSR